MIKTRSLLSLALLGLLAACAEAPSETDTAATKNTPYDTVAFCYSAKTTTREALAEMALEACPDGTVRVDVWDHDTLLNDCPISKKNRVTYRCLPQ